MAFEFVRDTVPHSADSGDLRVSWRGSEVLATRNGICHAKAHALAALLRAKPGVDARFALDREQLAFPVRPELGEIDYPELYAAPHPAVLRALRESADRPQLWRNLPTGL
ncbi:transglutaminase domain-containing protein [Streptomyces sp. NPDC002054]|uniref:transglutaminase domain-containing protein n=1 Tax=Streptomyces sp. NPDC002054 TaxID=3154663 RepID=UPI0033255861